MKLGFVVVYFSLWCCFFSSIMWAKFTFIVPQKPGGGTSIWASIVAKELEKKLGEKIIIRHLPGARDRIGFEKFHSQLRFNPKTVMVSHGGNAVSYLQEKVTFDYMDYDAIALMNNNIIVSRLKSLDWKNRTIVWAERSGGVPESMGIALLIDGPKVWRSWKKRVKYVKGMTTSEIRLAYRRGEVNMTRDNPAAHKKHVEPLRESVTFFHHGLYNAQKDTFVPDPNFPNTLTLEELYKRLWGEFPKGKLYSAYKMVKAWRDGVQKAMWVNKGNPHMNRLRKAVQDMLDDKETLSRLQKRLGKYPWHVGEDAENFVRSLYPLITSEALHTLVEFNRDALNIDSFYNKKRVYQQ